LWEGSLDFSGEHFRQDIVSAVEEGDPSSCLACVVAEFRNERDQACIDEGRGFSHFEHSCEGIKNVRCDFLCAFVEEFHGDAVVSGRLSFRKGVDGVMNLY
jgi:hypothetical protein